MKFCEIAEALGIKKYPAALAEKYDSMTEKPPIFDEAYLSELQEKYGALGTHEDDIKRAAAEILKHDARREYVYAACEYVKNCTIEEARALPVPVTDGTHGANMLPIFPLLSMIPDCVMGYKKIGMDQEEIDNYVKSIPNSIDVVNERSNLYGINAGFYRWLCIYTKCKIFKHGIFDVEVRYAPENAMVLKNRQNGEFALLLIGERYHRDGHRLGSAGFEDDAGAFDAVFTETDDAYIAVTAVDGLAQNKPITFKKSEWEPHIMPGDGIISLHIPKGRDISRENVMRDARSGLEAARIYYPEYNLKGIYCASWLLDPSIKDLLGDKSKIVGFGNCFLRFPSKSAGKELFSFVFPGDDPDNYAALTENTTLQRKAKQLYLDGKFVYSFCGYIVDEK